VRSGVLSATAFRVDHRGADHPAAFQVAMRYHNVVKRIDAAGTDSEDAPEIASKRS